MAGPPGEAPENSETTASEGVCAELCELLGMPSPSDMLVAFAAEKSAVGPGVVMRDGFEFEGPGAAFTADVIEVPARISLDLGGFGMPGVGVAGSLEIEARLLMTGPPDEMASVVCNPELMLRELDVPSDDALPGSSGGFRGGSEVAVAESLEIGARLSMTGPSDEMTSLVCDPELTLRELGVSSDDALPGLSGGFRGGSEGNCGLPGNPDVAGAPEGSLLVGSIAGTELIEVAFGMKESPARVVDLGIEGGRAEAVAGVVLLRGVSVAVVLMSMSAVTEVMTRDGSLNRRTKSKHEAHAGSRVWKRVASYIIDGKQES